MFLLLLLFFSCRKTFFKPILSREFYCHPLLFVRSIQFYYLVERKKKNKENILSNMQIRIHVFEKKKKK